MYVYKQAEREHTQFERRADAAEHHNADAHATTVVAAATTVAEGPRPAATTSRTLRM
jgi:hypothetical protein